jgi:transmembrane sensor
MPVPSTRLQYLLQQYANNNCTQQELLELMESINKNGDNQDLRQGLEGVWGQVSPKDFVPKIDKEQIFEQIVASGKVHKLQSRKQQLFRWFSAAVVLVALGFAFYQIKNNSKPLPAVASVQKNIGPGKDKAVLTLANGKTIVLGDKDGKVLIDKGNEFIVRVGHGRMAYKNESNDRPDANAYHTLTTPKGGQYQIELPDGTHVWLNASSSLRFPEKFQGNSRKVFLQGEGYFEVAKNKKMPFSVAVNNTEVKVLGTHFNIMGYNDEGTTNTTLLEGSVQIHEGALTRLLKPGQQAKVNNGIQISEVDPLTAVAWKEGNFNFGHEKIQVIMRKLSRWYNLDIKYEGKITSEGFVGNVPRSKNLSEVLDVLTSTGLVHFKVEERSVTVMP